MRYNHHIAFLTILVLMSPALKSQQGIYVPSKAKIFFKGDTATIGANVINRGEICIGKKAVINFTSQKWVNDPQSEITDEANNGNDVSANGGIVRFTSNSFRQLVGGGYNPATRKGPSFAHLYVENKNGIELVGSTKVSGELRLSSGLVYLNGNLLVVGNGNPGIISGYDSTHFLVAGGDTLGGMLLRESLCNSNGMVMFPLGSRADAYSPAGIHCKSAAGDDFFAGVTDSVFSGPYNLATQSVNKTWLIGKVLRPGADTVEVQLQHENSDEGSIFSANPANAYVCEFGNNGWETSPPASYTAIPNPVTGLPQTGSSINSRTFNNTIFSQSYLTVLVSVPSVAAKVGLSLTASRTDSSNVDVIWQTHPEVNNHYFLLQRKLSTDNAFVNIDTINSKAPLTAGYGTLNYNYKDGNTDHGITFYRLMMVSYQNDSSYSQTVAVGGGLQVHFLTWPNPAPGRFFAGMNGHADVRSVTVSDIAGRMLRKLDVNGQNIVEINGLIPGVYVVTFWSANGTILESKEVLVI